MSLMLQIHPNRYHRTVQDNYAGSSPSLLWLYQCPSYSHLRSSLILSVRLYPEAVSAVPDFH